MKIRVHWGAGVAAVYAVFAITTVGFVVFAIRQPVDLVSADYYAEGLRQDQHTAATEHARQLGAGVGMAHTTSDQLVLTIPQDQAASAHGRLTLYRASDAHADRVIDLHVDAHGRQDVAIGDLASGRWTAKLAWTAGGRAFYYETPLEIDK